MSPRCLEVGVGSGCIAVSLLLKVPNLTMVATDISPDALELCRHNANKHGVLERLELVETSVFDTIKSDTFDWIVSNPPYIAEDDQRSLMMSGALNPRLRYSLSPMVLR